MFTRSVHVWIKLCVPFLLLALPHLSRGEFVNNVETFSGTSFDLTTWMIRGDTSMITQNNGLTLTTGSIGEIGYSTRAITIGAGQSVRADLMLAPDTNGLYVTLANLFLSTRDGTPYPDYDTSSLAVTISTGPNSSTNIADQVNRGGYVFAQPAAYANTPYTFEIDRISSSQTTFLAYSGSQFLGSRTETHVSMGPLYITLMARGTSATFGNVTLGSVPEPASLGLLTGGGLTLLLRRAGQWRRERKNPTGSDLARN